MSKFFKRVLALVILPLSVLLSGCNSEEPSRPSEEPSRPDEVKLERIDIVASPIKTRGVSELTLAKGNQQSFEAVGHYSDGTSQAFTDLSVLDWDSSDSEVGRFDVPGVFTGIDVGNTTLTATKDGVTSNPVDVIVCNWAGTCIDIFDTGTGKLFTNSPSVAYLDSIGGSASNGTHTEKGFTGPAGDFYIFNWTNAGTLCDTYNTHSLGGRTNWRLATRDELKTELYDVYGNMFSARGWPTYHYYWSATPDGSRYYYVVLRNGIVISLNPSGTVYASCVSNPQS